MDIVENYDKWLRDNNIDNSHYLNICRIRLREIQNVFHTNQVQEKPETYLQVAWKGEPIHIFKYNTNINALQFKYWEIYGTIEVKDGVYYKYGRETPSNIFGWWLHGYGGEVPSRVRTSLE